MPRLMLPHEQPAVTPEFAVDWWASQGAPWFDDDIVERPIDAGRTAGLRTMLTGDPYRDRVRTNPSTPLQAVGRYNTAVKTWPWFSIRQVPLPEVVWHNGHTNPDVQWFGVDETRGLYWAVSSIRTGLLGWWAHGVWRHDFGRPWQEVKDMTGGGIPCWAMIPSPLKLTQMSGVQCALNFVVGGGYNRGTVSWVNKSDGGLAVHPLRAGERLRLTAEAFERLMAVANTAAERGLIWRLRYRGAIVNDKTSALAGHALRLAHGSDVDFGLGLHLLDFEVVYTP